MGARAGTARGRLGWRRQDGATLLVASLMVGALAAVAAAQEGTLTREQVSGIMATTRDLSGRNLGGLDLSRLNLSRADLRRAKLIGSNLEGADLWRADLADAELARARLVGANLSAADLSSADLTGADLSQANLSEAKLRKAKLGGRARLVATNLTKAGLSEVDLREASAEGAVFKSASLRLADLRGANLTDANLEGADLTGSQLANANLTRASLRRAELPRADFQGANLDGAIFVGSKHTQARNLDKAVNFERARWQEAPSAAPEAKRPAAVGPVTARIHLRSGAVLEVESWVEQDETVVYTQAGVTYGVARGEIAKIEDTQGRPIALRTPDKGSDEIFRCKPPKIGDSEVILLEFFQCTGARPSSRTRMREGRETTVYTVSSRASGYSTFWVLNGRVVQIDTASR
ncbi:MAG: pentapeptide repeat-containing protein [Candidatus Rokuibacteriota bacterium]